MKPRRERIRIWLDVLKAIRTDERRTRIAFVAEISYTPLLKILEKFDDLGLVISNKEGRTVFVHLTEKGKRAIDILTETCELLKI